jgi:hypothetical protein
MYQVYKVNCSSIITKKQKWLDGIQWVNDSHGKPPRIKKKIFQAKKTGLLFPHEQKIFKTDGKMASLYQN